MFVNSPEYTIPGGVFACRRTYHAHSNMDMNMETFLIKCQRKILGIRWYDRIRNTEITERTGLSLLMDLIINIINSLFGHVARLGNDTPARQALYCQIDISLGRLPDRPGDVLQVAEEVSGWIRFVLATISHRLIYGDVLSVEVILGRRNGPSRLRDNDDDDMDISWYIVVDIAALL